MYIGFIMAGDGEVDQCIGPYDTQAEAWEAITKIWTEHYNHEWDRSYVIAPQTYAEALQEIAEGKAEDEEYNMSRKGNGEDGKL